MINRSANFVLLHQLFEHWSCATPDAIAVVSGTDRLTYSSLNARANVIANELVVSGVKSGDLVGVCMRRSVDLIAAILAVLKIGCAYLPLDISQPFARLNYIMGDANPKVTIFDNNEDATMLTDKSLSLADICTQTASEVNVKVPAQYDDNSLCYIIYTSGTTGNPKGVCVNHSNVVNLLNAARDVYDFSEKDVWTLFHSYAFDFSVWEIWGALAFGGRLIIVPQETCQTPKDFYAFLVKNKVTVLNQTPAAFRHLANVATQPENTMALYLRYIIFGGDTLHTSSLREWFDKFGDESPKLFNMYGITETTVHVTYHRIRQSELESNRSVIGKPLKTYDICLLDENMKPVKPGATGEMCVSGPGVAQGYLNNPRLTREKFIVVKTAEGDSVLTYRSGDLAMMNSDGDLEYLGRSDRQVKLRGFRIELGEIEAQLNRQFDVRSSVVAVKGDSADKKRLVAFIQLKEGCTVTSQELRTRLKNWLPDYMIPAHMYIVRFMPMTSNNKIDMNFLLNNTNELIGVA